MPLEVRGVAIADPAGRAVRFAGVPIGGRAGIVIVCEVTAEALRFLADNSHAEKDELLGIFAANQEAIFKIASNQFDDGDHRPRVTIEDFRTLELSE
jgi:hypothetical protein